MEGETMRKALSHVNAKLSGMGFMPSSIFLPLLVPLHFVCHTSFLRFLSLTPYTSCLVTSPIHVLMSSSIFYFLLYMAFIFCMSPFPPSFLLYPFYPYNLSSYHPILSFVTRNLSFFFIKFSLFSKFVLVTPQSLPSLLFSFLFLPPPYLFLPFLSFLPAYFSPLLFLSFTSQLPPLLPCQVPCPTTSR